MKKSLSIIALSMLLLTSAQVQARNFDHPGNNQNFRQEQTQFRQEPQRINHRMQPAPQMRPAPNRGFVGINLNLGSFMLNVGI